MYWIQTLKRSINVIRIGNVFYGSGETACRPGAL